MGLFRHMRIHDSGIHRNADTTDTPCAPSTPAIRTATTMNGIPSASTNFSCPHCARNFNSRIGLVDHLRIHRTEAGGECSCGHLLLVPNFHVWLLEVWFFPVATPRATVTTGGLNQVRLSDVVCAPKPGMSDALTSYLSPLKNPYVGGNSKPVGGPG
ncbi:unnamed protein product [Schistocephalus solidus]|uniref:C2H2-type domain-containing protein n=1 Tax=Schistocephalus solidus TaxID=70667 RepID=A0A183TKN3_SCHSO|nr:unnamed protein product [Schistocephalus solidus]